MMIMSSLLYLRIAVGWLTDNDVRLELLEPPDEVDHVGTGLSSAK
jgi:hypothetical protein